MAGFKAAVTRRIGAPVWQRNYFEHIIRADQALDRIREYIANNPATWRQDRENANCTGPDQFHGWLTGTAAR